MITGILLGWRAPINLGLTLHSHLIGRALGWRELRMCSTMREKAVDLEKVRLGR